ncbi:uncharacterized protein LOC108735482 isoform X2 [Agrilus planipennis]|uniref:Uncharacterized protein LOC108735482 isoform X2 n=1 Tax=Agrilus planipennis TaxID=224129 RepID=A0A7F5RI92_AGRPL|nr:uncharacterized protein LOC108735482 isoform X2 [Agrilus planipennis]
MGKFGFLFIMTVAIVAFLWTENVISIPTSVPPQAVTYDEYVIEHAISSQSAKNVALSMDVNSKEPFGCQKCTDREMQYCLGNGLVNDHCCCDMNYTEKLPFIAHTCYFGRQLCKPVAGDCIEYQRLLLCCCNRHTLIHWKQKSVASNTPSLKAIVMLMLALYVWYLH